MAIQRLTDSAVSALIKKKMLESRLHFQTCSYSLLLFHFLFSKGLISKNGHTMQENWNLIHKSFAPNPGFRY